MRIVTVLDGEPWSAHHIAGSLSELGHDVTSFVYGKAVGEFYGRDRRAEQLDRNQALLDLVRSRLKSGGLDLVFCYVYDDFLLPDCAKELAATGVPLVNYNVDMSNQWYRQIGIAKYFTLMLCAQRIHMQALAAYGARTHYFPMAGRKTNATMRAKPVPEAPITFVGSPTSYRSRVLSLLQQKGLDIGIYGRRWLENDIVQPEYGTEKTLSDIRRYLWPRLRHEGLGGLGAAVASRLERSDARDNATAIPDMGNVHGPVPEEALAGFFSASRINLGFTRMQGLKDGRAGNRQVKLRDFEVPLAGGFYLVEEAPDHRELYDIGREIVTWQSVEELADKCRYYLAHPAERDRIAADGRARAERDHTWERRFSQLFGTLGLQQARPR